jgi:hypothetical protein
VRCGPLAEIPLRRAMISKMSWIQALKGLSVLDLSEV